jgi:hypothetical protein
VLGGAALDRIDDDLLGAAGRRLAGLGLEPFDQVCGVTPGVPLELRQQQLAGLFGAEPGDPLQLSLPLGHQLLGAGEVRHRGFFDGRNLPLAGADLLVEPLGAREPVGQGAGPVGERLLEGENLLTAVTEMALRVGGDLLRLLARVHDRFFAEPFRVALGLLHQGLRAGLGLLQQALDVGMGVERRLLLFVGAGLHGFRA